MEAAATAVMTTHAAPSWRARVRCPRASAVSVATRPRSAKKSDPYGPSQPRAQGSDAATAKSIAPKGSDLLGAAGGLGAATRYGLSSAASIPSRWTRSAKPSRSAVAGDEVIAS